jgi:hypothetical protein
MRRLPSALAIFLFAGSAFGEETSSIFDFIHRGDQTILSLTSGAPTTCTATSLPGGGTGCITADIIKIKVQEKHGRCYAVLPDFYIDTGNISSAKTITWQIINTDSKYRFANIKPAVALFSSEPQIVATNWEKSNRKNDKEYQWTLRVGATKTVVPDERIRYFPFIVRASNKKPCDIKDPIIGNGSN